MALATHPPVPQVAPATHSSRVTASIPAPVEIADIEDLPRIRTRTQSLALLAERVGHAHQYAREPARLFEIQWGCRLPRGWYSRRAIARAICVLHSERGARDFIVDRFWDGELYTVTISTDAVIVGASRCHFLDDALTLARAQAERNRGGDLPTDQELIGLLGGAHSKGDGPGFVEVAYLPDFTLGVSGTILLGTLSEQGNWSIEADFDASSIAANNSCSIALWRTTAGGAAPAGLLPVNDGVHFLLHTTKLGFNSGVAVTTTHQLQPTGSVFFSPGDMLHLVVVNPASGAWFAAIRLRTVEKNPGPGLRASAPKFVPSEALLKRCVEVCNSKGLDAVVRLERDQPEPGLATFIDEAKVFLAEVARARETVPSDSVDRLLMDLILGGDLLMLNGDDAHRAFDAVNAREEQPPRGSSGPPGGRRDGPPTKKAKTEEQERTLAKKREDERAARKAKRREENIAAVDEFIDTLMEGRPFTDFQMRTFMAHHPQQADYGRLAAKLPCDNQWQHFCNEMSYDTPLDRDLKVVQLLEEHFELRPDLTLFEVVAGYSLWKQRSWAKLMHSLVGNTMAEAVAKLPDVATPTPAKPAVLAVEMAFTGPKALGDACTVLGHVLRKGGKYVSPFNATRELAVGQWTNAQHPQASSQNSVGESTYAEFFESGMSEVHTLTAAAALLSARRYSVVSPVGTFNCRLTWSKSAAILTLSMSAGEMITQSQIVRINTSVASGDAMQRAILEARQKVEAGVTGSLAAPLLRLLLMVATEMPFLGPESAQAFGNTQDTLTPNSRVVDAPAVWWPLSTAATAVQPPLPARLITKGDETLIRAGAYTGPIPAGFTMDTWGSTTILVPINSDAINRGQMLAAWILAHAEHPFTPISYTMATSNDDGVAFVASVGHPMSNSCRVPGPSTNVLFVLENVFTSTGDTQLTVGSVAPAVVGYNANSFNGASVNIGPALTAEIGSSQRWPAALSMAIDYWDRVYGNEEDMLTAFLVAADHSFAIAPGPRRVGAAVVSGYATTAAPTTWNTTDYIQPIQANVDEVANGSTHPFDVTMGNSLAAVQNQSPRTCILGQFDSISASDVAWGLIRPVRETRGMVPKNCGEVMARLREVARIQSLIMDYIVSCRGYAMEELLNPANYAQNNTFAEIQQCWRQMYGILNNVVIEKVIDNPTVKYQGTGAAGLAKTFYTPQAGNTIPWGRVPRLYARKAGLSDGWHVPQTYQTKTFGPFRPRIGYPNPGNVSDQLMERPKAHDDPKADAYHRLGSLAIVSPAARFTLDTAIADEAGGSVLQLEWPAVHPSVGTGVGNVLVHYNPYNLLSQSLADTPILSLPPKRTARDGQNKYCMLFGPLAGTLARYEQQRYEMRLVQFSEGPNITQLIGDMKTDDPDDTLEYLGGSFRGAPAK